MNFIQSNHLIYSTFMAVILFTPLVASAQNTIMVCDFRYDRYPPMSDMIRDQLLDRNDYASGNCEALYRELDSYQLDIQDFFRDPELIRTISRQLGVMAFVSGRLDRLRGARELILTVFEGHSGSEMGTVSVEIVAGVADSTSLDWGLAEVETYIAWSSEVQPAEDTEEEISSNNAYTPPEEVVSPDPSLVSSASTRHEGGDPPWVTLSLGIDIVQRDFSITDTNNSGIRYNSGLYPGIEGELHFFPARLIKPGSLDGLSLSLRMARYFIETKLQQESLEIQEIPSRHKELGLLVGYSHPFGIFTLGTTFGYEKLSYLLGANPVYQSSEYRGISFQIQGGLSFLDELLQLNSAISLLPVPHLSENEEEAFGSGDSFGYGFETSLTYSPFDFLEFESRYRYQAFNTSYNGNNEGDLIGKLEGSDLYHHLGLFIRYEQQ
jgi:hypothetical protein